MVKNSLNLTKNREARHNGNQVQHGHGKKPFLGWLKCNYDVSHHERNRNSRIGWIIRNSNWTFLCCGMGKFQEHHSVKEA